MSGCSASVSDIEDWGKSIVNESGYSSVCSYYQRTTTSLTGSADGGFTFNCDSQDYASELKTYIYNNKTIVNGLSGYFTLISTSTASSSGQLSLYYSCDK